MFIIKQAMFFNQANKLLSDIRHE